MRHQPSTQRYDGFKLTSVLKSDTGEENPLIQ
jgi:hypothetical protein